MNRRDKGISLAKGPVGIIGLILLAYGITGLILGGRSFTGSFPDGTVQGENWLGLEGNGWSNLLAIAGGGLLVFGAPLHWGAKTMALIVGLAFGAASVISLVDGDDVLGLFAANGPTKLAWGIASAALLLLALLPRVGKGRKQDADDRGRETTTVRSTRDRVVTAEPQRERLVTERERIGERRPAADPAPVTPASTSASDESSGSRRTVSASDAAERSPDSGSRRVVAPADGDGPEDHGRGPAR